MRNLSFALALPLIGACASPSAPSHAALSQLHVCEALCTYRNKSGGIQRITLTTTASEAGVAWENLNQRCFEIESIVVKKPLVDLLILNPAFTSNEGVEFFKATPDNACHKVALNSSLAS